MDELDTTTFEDYLKRVIFDLLYFRRSTNKDTAWFRDKMHNIDLVPAVEARVDNILGLFEKYRRVTYDTQGIRDHGIDVLLRYQVGKETEGATKYIGFQIKSHDDLNQKGWLTKLKAQILEAHYSVNLEDLHVIFCADLAEHYQQLRDAMADLSKVKNTHIVRPEYAYAFLQTTIQTVAAYLKTILSAEDDVYKQAVVSLQEFTIQQAAIAIEIAASYYLEGKSEFTMQEIRNSQFVSTVYREYLRLPSEYYFGQSEKEEVIVNPDDDEDFVSDDLEGLELNMIAIDDYNGVISPYVQSLHPIGALVLDGYVRYGYSGHVLCEYLLSALQEDNIRMAVEYKNWMVSKP
jgi:hypothetical protein